MIPNKDWDILQNPSQLLELYHKIKIRLKTKVMLFIKILPIPSAVNPSWN